MKKGHRDNMEAIVGSLQECSFRRTGQCFESEGLPADTPCSAQGCTNWCHYEPCFNRFCLASEYYPDLDINPLREGLMVSFCRECATIRLQQNSVRKSLQRGSDSNTTQELHDNEDSNTTQDYDMEQYENIDSPVG